MEYFRLIAAFAALAASTLNAHAGTSILTNGGFESAWQTVSHTGNDGKVLFSYQPSGTDLGWTFSGVGTGIASSYSLLTAYEGRSFAFLQNVSGSLSRQFTLDSATALSLSFELALRPEYASGQVVQVLLDGQLLASYTAEQTTWVAQTSALGTLAAGTHTLSFKGQKAGSGDSAAYLDNIQITPALVAVSSVPEPQTYLLFCAGAVAVACARRRSKKASQPV